MRPSDHDEVERLKREGHTNHCAGRIVWGDGVCECGKSNPQGRSVSGEITKPAMGGHK